MGESVRRPPRRLTPGAIRLDPASCSTPGLVMGRKRRRARKKEKKQRKKDQKPTLSVYGWGTASADLSAVEFACGHDGLLRGAPEPVIVAGIYQVVGHAAVLVGRGLVRLHPTGSFPSTLAWEVGSGAPGTSLGAGRARTQPGDVLVLLACALEADSGDDVEEIYADLSDGGVFRVWPADADLPAPAALVELAPAEAEPTGSRVHVIRRGVDLRDGCRSDDFVGACAVVVAAARGVDHALRLRFVSPDGLNDWTAVARLRVS
jgi:hypothetical protein